ISTRMRQWPQRPVAGATGRAMTVHPKKDLPVLLLVAILPQALLALVRGHLMTLTFLTARHVLYCFSFLNSIRKRSTPSMIAVSCTILLYFSKLAMAWGMLSRVA